MAGHMSADGLGYTYENNGPGAPTQLDSGAGHCDRGGRSGGGVAYGLEDAPETLGSASTGNGGAAAVDGVFGL